MLRAIKIRLGNDIAVDQKNSQIIAYYKYMIRTIVLFLRQKHYFFFFK